MTSEEISMTKLRPFVSELYGTEKNEDTGEWTITIESTLWTRKWVLC